MAVIFYSHLSLSDLGDMIKMTIGQLRLEREKKTSTAKKYSLPATLRHGCSKKVSRAKNLRRFKSN